MQLTPFYYRVSQTLGPKETKCPIIPYLPIQRTNNKTALCPTKSLPKGIYRSIPPNWRRQRSIRQRAIVVVYRDIWHK